VRVEYGATPSLNGLLSVVTAPCDVVVVGSIPSSCNVVVTMLVVTVETFLAFSDPPTPPTITATMATSAMIITIMIPFLVR